MKRRPSEYIPPAVEDIRAHAREACDALLASDIDPAQRSEIFHGYIEFLQLAGRIQAKHRNRSGLLDSGSA